MKYTNRQLLFIGMTMIPLICTPLMPIAPTFWIICLLVFLTDMANAVLDCGTYLWIIEMWPKYFNNVLHLSRVFYTLGIFITPILIAPFLEGDVTKLRSDYLSLNQTTKDSINFSIDRRPKLIIPFLMCGAITSIGKLTLNIEISIKIYFCSNSCPGNYVYY